MLALLHDADMNLLPSLPPPPLCPQVYDLAGTFAARAQQTWIVAKAKENLLPYAQPTMDSGEGRLWAGGRVVRGGMQGWW